MSNVAHLRPKGMYKGPYVWYYIVSFAGQWRGYLGLLLCGYNKNYNIYKTVRIRLTETINTLSRFRAWHYLYNIIS